MSFLKKGAAVHQEVEKADQQQASLFGPQRFWIKEGQEARITFVDGTLQDGLLQSASYYEHMIERGGGKSGFDNYPCTQESEACPICEDKHGKQPSLVFAFTIIDHRTWKDKDDKVHQHEKRLLVCKRQTFKMLQIKAAKFMQPVAGLSGKETPPKGINGLVGVTFLVTRTGEKSASVGSDYDFVDCNPLSVVATECKLKPEDIIPMNYDEVIRYYPASELRKMGFGIQGAIGHSDHKVTGAEPKSTFGGSTFDASKEL